MTIVDDIGIDIQDLCDVNTFLNLSQSLACFLKFIFRLEKSSWYFWVQCNNSFLFLSSNRSFLWLDGKLPLWWLFVSSFNIFLIFDVLLLLQCLHSLKRWLWAWLQWRVAATAATCVIDVSLDWCYLQVLSINFLSIFLWRFHVVRVFFILSLLLLFSLLAFTVFFLGVHLLRAFLWADADGWQFQGVSFHWACELRIFHWRNVFHIFFHWWFLKWWFTWALSWRNHIFHVHELKIFRTLSNLTVFSLDKLKKLIKYLSSSFWMILLRNSLRKLLSLLAQKFIKHFHFFIDCVTELRIFLSLLFFGWRFPSGAIIRFFLHIFFGLDLSQFKRKLVVIAEAFNWTKTLFIIILEFFLFWN